ncbi:SLAC1 family transporter [Puerhibacterium puerhi]|uniref:SLAC1 family transporter n=1 Tax=Puerhibacterium puerhi TaxID=2692623 RepID=UPI00135BD31B|nr:C4-dicarboxylate transporter [Puerhibacterium puerhi]
MSAVQELSALPAAEPRETPAGRPARPRLPLNTFGIAFGLSGLAGTWTAAAAQLGAPRAVGEALWALAAVVWMTTVVRYAARLRSPRDLGEDLRHPVLGPFAALVPTTASLLAAHAAGVGPLRVAATVAVDLAAAAALAFLAWFVADLLTRPRDLAALHGGYLLPSVAASLVAAQSLATVGQRAAAVAALGVGLLFWVLIGAALLARLATGPQVPGGLLPTLAIFSAPPAVAGNAWWAIDGAATPVVHQLLLGTMVALLAPQLFLVRRYLRQPFAIGFWALTFTAAASATYALRLATQAPGSASGAVVGWLVVAAATAVVGTVGVRSLALLRPRPRAAR